MRKIAVAVAAAALASAALVSSVEYVPAIGTGARPSASPGVVCRARTCLAPAE